MCCWVGRLGKMGTWEAVGRACGGMFGVQSLGEKQTAEEKALRGVAPHCRHCSQTQNIWIGFILLADDRAMTRPSEIWLSECWLQQSSISNRQRPCFSDPSLPNSVWLHILRSLSPSWPCWLPWHLVRIPFLLQVHKSSLLTAAPAAVSAAPIYLLNTCQGPCKNPGLIRPFDGLILFRHLITLNHKENTQCRGTYQQIQ